MSVQISYEIIGRVLEQQCMNDGTECQAYNTCGTGEECGMVFDS